MLLPNLKFYNEFKDKLFKSKVDEDDLSYASSAASAILYQSPKGGQTLLWVIVLCTVLFLVWAAFAKIDEFTRGYGQVIPSQYLQTIQNLEGGIVAEVFVSEGQQVKRDEVLVRLDDKRFSSDLNASENRQDQLLVKSLRLLAESEGKNFSEYKFTNGISEKLIKLEENLYLKRAQEQESNQKIITEQVIQKKQKLSTAKSKLNQLEQSYNFLKEELMLTEPLVLQGAASEVEVLRLRRQLNDLDGEINAAQLAIPQITASINESKLKLQAVISSFRSQAQSDYIKAQEELTTLQKSSESIVDQVDRTLVRSPVAGTIKQLFVKTLGGVIQPGNNIVTIIPTEESLRVEVKINPKDIAFLHPGQSAMVKLTAYDFSIYGGLKSKVVHISPDTITDREGNSFYVIQVETVRGYLGPKETPLQVIAGMTANVDILTGSKTILDYILKPILKTKQVALRER